MFSLSKVLLTASKSYSLENTANHFSCFNWNGTTKGNVTTVGTNGGPSAYGTYDQTGNVNEWVISAGTVTAVGGAFWENINVTQGRTYEPNSSNTLNSWSYSPAIGFRICTAAGPEGNPMGLPNFVSIGNPGNPGGSSFWSRGGVNYEYRINKYPVTNCDYLRFLRMTSKVQFSLGSGQFSSLGSPWIDPMGGSADIIGGNYQSLPAGMESSKAVSANNPYGGILSEAGPTASQEPDPGRRCRTIYEGRIKMSVPLAPNTPGAPPGNSTTPPDVPGLFAHKPVVYVSFLNAVRYCNWLHNGMPKLVESTNPETQIYYLNDGAYDIRNMNFGPTGDGRSAPLKKEGAKYWIPTIDEWVKAGFSKLSKSGQFLGYWTHATQSDVVGFAGNNDYLQFQFGKGRLPTGINCTMPPEDVCFWS